MKKLHASKDDKLILGICGGIAESIGMNSNLVRLIFIASVFAGSAGLWIYLILAVIMPKKKIEDEIIDVEIKDKNKIADVEAVEDENKITRPWENRILGGVCAGIARYLSWDVTLVRLIFVGMSFVGGIGTILYLFFWFLFPSEE